MFARMIEGFAQAERIDLDTPFDDLDGRSRRIILHGAGETWYHVWRRHRRPAVCGEVARPRHHAAAKSARKMPMAPGGFSFQYKGLFPAIEEAGRVSFVYRFKLQGMVDDVPCAGCMGARLRDDAAAVRFKGFTLDQISRWPLEPDAGVLQRARARRR